MESLAKGDHLAGQSYYNSGSRSVSGAREGKGKALKQKGKPAGVHELIFCDYERRPVLRHDTSGSRATVVSEDTYTDGKKGRARARNSYTRWGD